MQGDLTLFTTTGVTDAYTRYGISLTPQTLSALLQPPPAKEHVLSASPLEHGTDYFASRRIDQRDLTLPLVLTAATEKQFFTSLENFTTQFLTQPVLKFYTRYQPLVFYRCLYRGFRQFTEFQRGIAHFTLDLLEPDPTDRAVAAKAHTWNNF